MNNNEIPASNNHWMRLTKVLRWSGAIAIIASAITFLYQNIGTLSSIQKYATFLGFTTILGAAGIFCGIKWKEDKGARTFLGIATATIPAHFAQIGGFIYFLLFGIPGHLPSLLVVSGPNLASVIAISSIAFLILIPVAFLGFSSLMRKHSKILTSTFLLLNFLILLPLRTNAGIAAVIALQFILLFVLEKKSLKNESHMASLDGKLIHGIMLSPIIITMGRGIFYPISYLCFSIGLGAAGAYLYSILPQYFKSKSIKTFSKNVSYFFMWQSWVVFINGIAKNLPGLYEYNTVLAYLPISVILIFFSFYRKNHGRDMRLLGSISALFIIFSQLNRSNDIFASFICIFASAALIVLGFTAEEKAPLFSGVIGVIIGFGYHFSYAYMIYSMVPWVSLAITGLIVIFLSSYIEKNWKRDLERLIKIQKQLKAWN